MKLKINYISSNRVFIYLIQVYLYLIKVYLYLDGIN